MPKLEIASNFEAKRIAFLLMISMVSMVSIVSSSASKHLCNLALTGHTVPGQWALLLTTTTLTIHTILDHRSPYCWLPFPVFLWWQCRYHCHPQIICIHIVVLRIIWGWWGPFESFLPQCFVIITTTYHNIVFRKVYIFILDSILQKVTLYRIFTYYFHLPLPIVLWAMTSLFIGLGGISSLQEYRNTLGMLNA